VAHHLNQAPLNRIDERVKELNLQSHPEGGFYSENYRSEINTEDKRGVLMTSIYFLLTSEHVSHFHRIKNDELWFHHEGSPISIHTLENGVHIEHILGKTHGTDCRPYQLIKGNTIFGSSVLEANSYALVSCVVSPGFDFKDFELFSHEQLLKDFPNEEEIIDLLTP
jgi:predicted cupin superfamily sugar epimerase